MCRNALRIGVSTSEQSVLLGKMTLTTEAVVRFGEICNSKHRGTISFTFIPGLLLQHTAELSTAVARRSTSEEKKEVVRKESWMESENRDDE